MQLVVTCGRFARVPVSFLSTSVHCRLTAARGLGLLYGSNMAGGRYAYPYGPSPTDESLKLKVLDDEKHSVVLD